jgi:putative ABC transport system permease protein
MSALKPADVLKGQKKGLRSKSFLRNTLVIGQFAVTIVLLIGSITVFKQLNFFNIKDTGMNRGQVVAVATNDPEVWNSFQTLETELLALPSITEVSTSQYNPVRLSRKISDIKWESKQVDDQLSAYVSPVGFNFVELLDIELIAGRSFSKELYKETSTDYLLNESAIRQLGWTREEAIGKSFSAWGNDGKIVGVVKDFNYLSLHHEIEPLVIYLKPNINQRMVLARINADNTQQTLAQLETIFTKFSAEGSFSHFFLDDSFKNQYRDDQRLSSFFNYFTLLAFLIAGLGLFGLTTFMIEQRKKEIGIRKVLGATLIQILLLLNKDFLRPIIFSFLLALPVGWYLSNQWLMGFAYKIDLSIWIFLSAGLITIFISLITVIWQSVKTALMNPIESLRIE